MNDDFENELLTGAGKWWEFLDPETYQVRSDLPSANRDASPALDWSRARPRASGPVGFAFFNHCQDCGQGLPPDFTFCVHCGGAPRSADPLRTFTIVVAQFDSEPAREAAIELISAAGDELAPAEVAGLFEDLPAVFNLEARRDQVAALTAKLAEVGIAARAFSVDDPSLPWFRETLESIARQPVMLAMALGIVVFGGVFTWFWSAGALLLAFGAAVVMLGYELRWYRNRYHVDATTLLELVTGFDRATAEVARQTLRSMGDREARAHVTVCLMEYYTLTQQLRAHGAVYGDVLNRTGDALQTLMADVLTLAHRYSRMDRFVTENPSAALEQRLEVLRADTATDKIARGMIESEIAVLGEQLDTVRTMEGTRTAFRDRLGALARSMELMRARFAAVRAQPSEDAFRELAFDEALRELDEEFEVFEQTFAVVQ